MSLSMFHHVPSLHFGQANSVVAPRVQWNVHQRTRVVPQQAQLVPQLPSQADGWLSMGCGRIIIATHIELTPPPQATTLQSERYVNDSFVQLHAELPAQPSKLRRLCGKHALCPPQCLLLKYPNASFVFKSNIELQIPCRLVLHEVYVSVLGP
jgi:hypothetical protein